MRKKISLAAIAGLVASTVIFAGANTSANANSNPLNLVKPGSLVVGMTLQFKPQMYLDEAGKPAGYDVELVKRLAKALRLKLEIKNMDFAGLIPGLVSKQFDLVSVGLTKNPDREKSIQFVREYMPYTTVLAARTGDSTGATKALWNVAGKKVTALQGAAAGARSGESAQVRNEAALHRHQDLSVAGSADSQALSREPGDHEPHSRELAGAC